MKICVLGAGALGCTLGGLLARTGHEVWLINHRAEQVDAMNSHGLIMRIDGRDEVQPVKAAIHCAGVDLASGPVDLIILLVKSFDTEPAIRSASAILGKGTIVLSLQNGLGHEEVLAQFMDRGQILAGKTYVGGVLLKPGQIVCGTKNKKTIVGELDGQLTERVQGISNAFNEAGLLTEVSDNIRGVIWDKLLVNVATGALSGVTQLTYGDLYTLDAIEACGIAAAEEGMRVAKAEGVHLSIKDPKEAWLRASAGLPKEFKASMLQSIQKGSRTEIDFINGSVVRAAKKYGIATPVNNTLIACIKGIEHALVVASRKESTPTNE